MKPRNWATPPFCAIGAGLSTPDANLRVLKSSHGTVAEIIGKIVPAAKARTTAVATRGFRRRQSCDSGDLGRGRHDSPRDGIDLWSSCTRRRIAGPCAADRLGIESGARRIEPAVASRRRRRWPDRVSEDIPAASGAIAASARGACARQGWPCGPFVHCGCRSTLTSVVHSNVATHRRSRGQPAEFSFWGMKDRGAT